VHALASQFSRVRSFVFIDGIDEVTTFFEGNVDLGDAVKRINTEADVVWVDGHSDYGHAFEVFHAKWGNEVTPKTSVIILGGAPVCWAHLLCPECGAMPDPGEEDLERCPRCGADRPRPEPSGR